MSSMAMTTVTMLAQITLRKKQYENLLGRRMSHWEEKIFTQGFTAGRVDAINEIGSRKRAERPLPEPTEHVMI